MTEKQIVLISDFDGTISKNDFFWYAIDEYLKPEDMYPWEDYKAGKITHVDALSKIFEQIKAPTENFHKFILSLPIQEDFVATASLCSEKNIPFHILSAGTDYYINMIMKNLGVDSIVEVLSNKATYDQLNGLKFCKVREDHPYYSKNLGISKEKFVKEFKDKGYFIIFAGDGRPDIDPARLADVVFARKDLLEMCNQQGIETKDFNSYKDIYNYIRSLDANSQQ